MEVTKNTAVDYNDAKHLYSLQDQRYTSASQIVGLFTPPFDTWAVATNYAAKHGGTPEYWVDQWSQKTTKSLVRGNKIHDANELVLNARMIDVIEGEVLPVQGDRYDDNYPWFERPDGVYTERKLWHHGYRAAGRSDKVILRTVNKSLQVEGSELSLPSVTRYADVEDYKTNESIDKVSYQFKNGNFKMMKPPIAHIMSSNYWHYALQLSLYMFMLEYQGFEPGNIRIIHYPHPTEANPNPERVYYDLPYMKREVINMLSFINR